MEQSIDKRVGSSIQGFLKDAIEYQKQNIRYLGMNREIICKTSICDYGKRGKNRKTDNILFKNENGYFFERDGKIVCSGETRAECVKRAFSAGYLSDDDYILFRAGHKAMTQYVTQKQNEAKLRRRL
ncbi:MAG: hypothetical protein IKO25_09210 [Clostridia bacterium]|nr:hypothetical protein [Clostridia bacterium]